MTEREAGAEQEMASEVSDQEEESLEGYVVDPSGIDPQGVRTYFVFVDLPQHLEFRVGNMPLLNKGTEIDLDMALRHPRNPKKVRRVQGVHTVIRRLLKFSTTRPGSMGLSQYLEIIAGPAPR